MSIYNNNSSVQIPPPNIGLVPTQPSPELTKDITKDTTQSGKKDLILNEKKNPISSYVKFSFMITNILLLTTATLTLIEALRTDIPSVRHILNLETCISLVAGYFYSVFLAQIQEYEKEDKPIKWSDISKTRYVDWAITTPLMLVTLCVVLSIESKTKVQLHTILQIIGLNYVMLFLGFMGEMGNISRLVACFSGFLPFILMFYIIYVCFVKRHSSFSSSFLYYFYLIIWSLYGIVYLFPENIKNICMNILDCIAKCLIGNGLFIYYSGIIKGW
jgi:bacteriorhodopsin